MRLNSYKELIAYNKKSLELLLLVYKLTSKFPEEEMYSLVSQVRRCAVSIPSNIAEGYTQGKKEYIPFLKVVLGSAAKFETQFLISSKSGYCNENEFEKIYTNNQEVIKLLQSYILNFLKEIANP